MFPTNFFPWPQFDLLNISWPSWTTLVLTEARFMQIVVFLYFFHSEEYREPFETCLAPIFWSRSTIWETLIWSNYCWLIYSRTCLQIFYAFGIFLKVLQIWALLSKPRRKDKVECCHCVPFCATVIGRKPCMNVTDKEKRDFPVLKWNQTSFRDGDAALLR